MGDLLRRLQCQESHGSVLLLFNGLKGFDSIKTAFPELSAFRATIENLPNRIPEWLWETGHIYDLYITVENMLKVKRFSDKN